MNTKLSSHRYFKLLFLLLANTALFGQSPGGVAAPGSMVSGVNYSLYSGGDAVLSDGIQTTFMHTGYINDFFRHDSYVKDEIGSNFSMRLTSTLTLVNAGTYQFQFLNTDDNAYLLLDGNAIITTPGLGTFTSAVQNLSAGNHSLEVRYSDVGGVTNLELKWRGTVGGLDVGTTFVNIANNKLFTTPLMSAWYKANSGIGGAEGSSPGTWSDNSSNANNLTLISGNNPLYYATTAAQLINFNPSVDFTNDEYAGPNNSNGIAMGNQSKSVFAVITKPFYNAGTGFISTIGRDQVSNTSFGLYTTGANARVAGFNTWQQATGYFTANQNNVPNVLGGVYSNTNILGSNNAFLYGNGLMVSNGTQNWATTLNDNEDVNVGKENWTGSTGHTGKLMEVIHYPWNLSATERVRVESYLALKYGITLGNTSNAVSYVNSQGAIIWTGNGTYQNNVAGIGRDDNSALQQKQSSSMNTYSTQVLIGNGNSLFGTNASNTNVFSSDLSFLMWGDNSGSTNFSTAFTVNPLYDLRMARVWKVQETGTLGNVIVGWPYPATNLALVTNPSDPTFTSGNTYYPLSGVPVTINGVNFYTVAVDLANNSFFTFAASVGAPGGVSANLSFWSKSDINMDSGAWPDNSGNLNPVEIAGSLSVSPANANHNFQPYYKGFSSANYFLESNCSFAGNAIYTPTSLSAFSAITPSSATSAGRITGTDNDPLFSGEPYLSLNASGKPRYYKYWGNTNSLNHANSVVANQSSLAHFTANQSTKLLQVGLNNLISSTSFLGDNFGNWGPYMTIGYGSYNLSGAFPGDVMEIIWYTNALSNAEQLRVNSYLAIKYGITLNQTSPTNYVASNGTTKVWNATTNSGYNNNIIGLAQDARTALFQKQARSAAGNDVLSMFLGSTKYSANAANTSTFSGGISSYFMAGTDAQAVLNTVYPHPDVPVGTNSRLKRVWKSQITNFTNTNLSFEFDLTGYATGPMYASDLRLLVDGDGVFATGATMYGATTSPSVSVTLVGQVVTISGIDAAWFASNPYFTLGSILGSTQLPVELTDFEATCNEVKQRIDLRWKTASELNNDYFTVEQSKDVIDWTEVGSLKGAGVSNSQHSYELSDYINETGVFYYRLRQTDYNGIEKYFHEIKSIEKCYTNSFITYPNPANTFINLEGEGIAKIEVLNNVGVVVARENVGTKAVNHAVNLSTLVSGIYYLKVYFIDGHTQFEKVIKKED
ncbi:MAG: T9SS type A sorting domain-containing protein [Bacteroidia bacterium]|nr:T9SS type A sorting domain-containing protein [Bacteroidia bacterium]